MCAPSWLFAYWVFGISTGASSLARLGSCNPRVLSVSADAGGQRTEHRPRGLGLLGQELAEGLTVQHETADLVLGDDARRARPVVQHRDLPDEVPGPNPSTRPPVLHDLRATLQQHEQGLARTALADQLCARV